MSTTIYHFHHIVPKHIGGTDDPSNLIRLTVEEHAEEHRKLYEEYGRWQDHVAWKGLSGQITCAEAIKLAQSIANSRPKTGSALIACRENGKKANGAWKGKHHTEESKRIISENSRRFHTGRPKLKHRKKVCGDGMVYESLNSAAEINGVTRQTIHNRIKSEKYEWYKM
tara:strand:+ start:281 stop:787 length:507 start_codon:yes stop_codon:yes gene_type:complete